MTEKPDRIWRSKLQKVQPKTENQLHLPVFCIAACLLMIIGNTLQAGIDYTKIGYRTATIYTEGEQNRWIMSESYTEARISTEAPGLQMALKFAHSQPSGDLRWGYNRTLTASSDIGGAEDGALSGRIFFQEPYIQTILSAMTLNKRLSASLGWRHKSGGRDELSAEIWFQPTHALSAGIKRSKAYPLPAYSELFYEYKNSDGVYSREGGRLNWRGPARMTELKLFFAPTERITAESIIREADFIPDIPVSGESPTDVYLGVLEGLWYDSQIRASYLINPNWSAIVGYRQIGIHMRLRAYDGGQQFAHFGVVEADGRLWSFKVACHGWRIDFYAGHAEGELKGVIEAWPFVDGLLLFLGERRHFIGIADVDWKYASCGGLLFNSRKLNLNASLDYFHILPNLRYTTWRPKMFGMGIDDLKADRLDLVRADLIRLVLKPTIKFNRWRVELNVSQWIPLSTKKIQNGQLSELPADISSSPDSKENLWGGFSATISLKAEF